jgi:hypothetical protein
MARAADPVIALAWLTRARFACCKFADRFCPAVRGSCPPKHRLEAAHRAYLSLGNQWTAL